LYFYHPQYARFLSKEKKMNKAKKKSFLRKKSLKAISDQVDDAEVFNSILCKQERFLGRKKIFTPKIFKEGKALLF